MITPGGHAASMPGDRRARVGWLAAMDAQAAADRGAIRAVTAAERVRAALPAEGHG